MTSTSPHPVSLLADGAVPAQVPCAPAEPAVLPGLNGPAGSIPPLSSEETAAPDAREASGAGTEVTIRLPPAVTVILRLLEVSTDLPVDEIIARGIGFYASKLQLPILARDMAFDLVDVPEFERRASRKFKGADP